MKKECIMVSMVMVMVMGIAILSCSCPCSADDDGYHDGPHHAASGTGQNIGKAADNVGKDIGRNASTVGQNAAQGAGGIVSSVGQFLQGLGADMSQPAQKQAEPLPAVKPSTAVTDEKAKSSEETDIVTGYENAAQKTSDLDLSCPGCGQKFQVTGFPKGSKAYCPACGKPVEQQQ
jgi:hypothetical protein